MWLFLAALLAMPPADSLAAIEKLIAAGQYREALQSLNRQPAASVRWHLLASKSYDGLQDAGRAVEHAEKALAIDPRAEPAHLQLGQIFLSHNTPAAALEIFSEALQLLPGSLYLRLGKGLALKDLSRYEEAEAEFQTCLKMKPDFSLAFDSLATVYLHSKRFEDGIRLADDYRKKFPADYRGPYFAAAAREGLKDSDREVEKLLRESIRLNANFAASHALLGKLLLQRADTAAAIGALENAVRLRPDYTPAVLHLAQAYRKAGRDADATKAFEMVRVLKEKEQQPAPSLRYHRGDRAGPKD
jgi:tetratricopeptide (TPR) repeat protein